MRERERERERVHYVGCMGVLQLCGRKQHEKTRTKAAQRGHVHNDRLAHTTVHSQSREAYTGHT